MNNVEPHRKRVKHFHQKGDFHELTFSCYRRLPLLTNDCWRTELSNCIKQANEEFRFELVAFVYMPEHVHMLVLPQSDAPDIGSYLAQVKQPLSKFVKNKLEESNSTLLKRLTIRERPGKYCFRFWQEGPGFDRNLFSLKAIEASIDYIHLNPVARGLCPRATDWKWSSARYYLGLPAGQQHENLPFIHGLRPDVFDRDERC
jgi:putative transposase